MRAREAMVTQFDRERAKDEAQSIVRHQLWRTYDALREAQDVDHDPAALISAIDKLQALGGRAQQTARLYAALHAAWKENEPKPTGIPMEPVSPFTTDPTSF